MLLYYGTGCMGDSSAYQAEDTRKDTSLTAKRQFTSYITLLHTYSLSFCEIPTQFLLLIHLVIWEDKAVAQAL